LRASTRIAIAVATLVRSAWRLGIPMPAGIRLLHARAPQMVTWAWGINARCRRRGHPGHLHRDELGFGVTLLGASMIYLIGLAALIFSR